MRNNMTIHERFHQYELLLRWDKPIGTLLLLWPTLTAVLLANNGHPSAELTFIFFIGVFIMRAAGCIINDLADRKFDKYVHRTQTRPLTAKTIKTLEALIVLFILLTIALILVLQLNLYSLILAIIGILLSVIYPFMKRWIPLPQGILSIVFNIGILMAFAASNNSIYFSGWLLFLLALIWTIAYDSMYAMSDKEDDLKLGLKSSVILFDKNDRTIIASLQIGVVFLLLLLGVIEQLNHWFYIGIFFTLLTFIYQQWLIYNREPALCLQAFSNNHWSWFFIFFSVYLSFH